MSATHINRVLRYIDGKKRKKGNVVLSTRQTVPQDPTEQPRKLVRPVAHRKTGERARRRTHTHSKKGPQEGKLYHWGLQRQRQQQPLKSDPPTLSGNVQSRGSSSELTRYQLSFVCSLFPQEVRATEQGLGREIETETDKQRQKDSQTAKRVEKGETPNEKETHDDE